MGRNPLFDLQPQGQSIWYDNISRTLITSGGLKQLIADYAVVGVTSNPTIFQKALAEGADYDEDIRALNDAGEEAEAIFEKVATDDIRNACDVFTEIFEKSNHIDGRVSIEVGPSAAFETDLTITDARRLWKTVNRPNLMVKIPGTNEGIPAIQKAISEGMSINVTLLFAVSMYEKVMEAYLSGLEERLASGQPHDQLHSVASFFGSRVDTLVDKELDAKISASTDADEKAKLKALQGKAAVANAKMAYQAFKKYFSGPRWEALASHGANIQRPLWASTGTKNPAYPDTMYIAELVGPHTVNTVPDATLKAFADHGVVRGNTVEENVEAAQQVMDQLAAAGIDMEDITANKLVSEGVKSFVDSFDKLIDQLRKKRDEVVTSGD